MSKAILIVAHEPLATALRAASLHVFPDAAGIVTAVDVAASATAEQTAQQLAHALEAIASEDVLVLTDVFGASPCNVAQRAMAGKKARLIAGANLPMILRAINYLDEPLEVLVPKVLAGAAQCIMAVNLTAPQNQHTRKVHDQQHNHHQQ
ncbi:PTS fructose transporter subunit IIA [Curvibacter sp. CHRR-16]|uniref:PTS sugar transporter subunit IIA n=1 Tax=Curvibacter sp. CHRR-16 TaxID=2835872 RepID=UPI001BD990FF|nr:PTS fructose transporter subunit IIA [Curvibacter sp. CHRR-16]MBT0571838.1 PTS fructose transporter subunit IIA [Curvibacter sp. CHRR-16]